MSAQAEPSLDVLAAQVSALDCENNEMPCAAYSLRQLADTVTRLRAENEALRSALDEIVDDLSVPNRPAPWAAHALQVAQVALEGGPS